MKNYLKREEKIEDLRNLCYLNVDRNKTYTARFIKKVIRICADKSGIKLTAKERAILNTSIMNYLNPIKGLRFMS
tara:strand:+ start:286 stop:510 length:225 start_codon:yes stop_codon:yes gene_type:complete